jgi:hypothetical protein
MKVRPIAATTPLIPIGIKFEKFISQLGLPFITHKPAAIKMKIKPSWIIVTTSPVLPVSDVPLILI